MYNVIMRYFLASFVAILFFGLPWLAFNYPSQTQNFLSLFGPTGDELAAIILSHNPKTVAQIQSKYASATPQSDKKVRILLVAGHEPHYGGAEYGDLKERNMTVELAADLKAFLGKNPKYQVYTVRDAENWNPEFSAYFKNDWSDIIAWQKASHEEMSHLIAVGSTTAALPKVFHNTAPQDVALRLYGITKWSNENDIDITIHVHFNDYPTHPWRTPGKYSGFAIYVPAAQYGNSATTKAIAENVFNRLSKYNAVSDFPGEATGIVDEPELIAVGANNTADAASMLIEYGYLYEPQFTNSDLRSLAIEDLAFQTYLGLQDFFDKNSAINTAGSFGSLFLPHEWQNSIGTAFASSSEIFALQTALVADGDYPPFDRSKNDCPRTGTIGPCTKAAIDSFQKKYGITGEQGVVGPKTLQKLSNL